VGLLSGFCGLWCDYVFGCVSRFSCDKCWLFVSDCKLSVCFFLDFCREPPSFQVCCVFVFIGQEGDKESAKGGTETALVWD